MGESAAGGGDGEPAFEVRLLGTVQVLCRGNALEIGGTLQKSVLVTLLLHPGQTLPKQTVIEALWGLDAPRTAENLIGSYLSRLRATLAPADDRIRLRSMRPGFRAECDPLVVDAHRLKALVRQADRDRAEGEDQKAATRLREALDLWHGNTIALADLESARLRAEAASLEGWRLDALERLACIELDAGCPDEAMALLREHQPTPDRENLTAVLVRALIGVGEPSRAADIAAAASAALIELGKQPGAELRTAQAAALRNPAPRSAPPRRRLRELPPDTSAFTGRHAELGELLALAARTGAADAPGAVAVCTIDGMAGVGKTALAVRAGHQLADRFPDGQIFLELRGCTRGMEPREPADVIASILRRLGVPPAQIPMGLNARAALYRDRLAGTRTLILLDNAADEEQVRPLLPAAAGCLVLITSRKRLKSLDDAHPLPLGVLPLPDAVELLRGVAMLDAGAAHDPMLEHVALLCGRLPLALRIAGALVRRNEAWDLKRLADRLAEFRPGGELDGFSDGGRELTGVFDLSLRTLAKDRQRLFRRLGVIPGPDIDAFAAAALLNLDPVVSERFLRDLVDHNLLLEQKPGRYVMHDLTRRHARALAERDSARERADAVERLLDYYHRTAALAQANCARSAPTLARERVPAHTPAVSDADQARAWLRAERANIVSCLKLAAQQGRDRQVVALGASLAGLLRTDGPWTQALTVHAMSLTAAEHLGDRLGQADALTELGTVRRLAGHCQDAARDLRRAWMLYRDFGERPGQAYTLTQLGAVARLTGRYQDAVHYLDAARELYEGLGDRHGEAYALTYIGVVHHLTGEYVSATRDLHTARELYRHLEDRLGQANALTYLGAVRYMTGDLPGASRDLQSAWELSCGFGDRHGEACALARLGVVRRLTGDLAGAMRHLRAALTLYRELGNVHGQAEALTELGAARRLAGDLAAAKQDLEAALELYRESGSRGGEARALNPYASVIAATGELAQACALHRAALGLARDVQQPDDEAMALEGIGECLLGEADVEGGAAHLNQALVIFQRLGVRPGVERVQARLAQLDPPDAGAARNGNT
ncbi:MAG TPA: tetratricopeptide repeat protein [Actinocrinis sp.]